MIKNKDVRIEKQENEIVVTDGTVEFYRAKNTEQTRGIAVDIYFYHKYEPKPGMFVEVQDEI